MLDIKFIRSNPDLVKEGCRKKQVEVDIGRLLNTDEKKREALQALEDMQAQKNKASKEISKAETEKEKQKIILQMKELDKNSDRLNKTLKELKKEFNDLMLQIPNLPFDDVPVGKNENENVVLRKWGEKPKFDFQPKDYLTLAENLDLIDIKRAAIIAGTRFYYLKNEGALLEIALINLAFDLLTKREFIPVIPPVMITPEIAKGLGYLEEEKYPEKDPDAYFIETGRKYDLRQGFYLVGTSEQSLVAMHTGEVLEEKELPKRYTGFSTCFRKEAGSYGKDTKGIFRVHQFDKVEMVVFCKPEDSEKEHRTILSIQEELMQKLRIPYRVMNICTGDLGRPAARKYDIEAWIPSEGKHKETHSTSNCTDFQARRLEIRYRGKNNQLNFVHTLNGTAFAIGRTLIAIIENYQQRDGSILVPEVLQKYLSFKIIRPVK